jgi:hypothetical protein
VYRDLKPENILLGQVCGAGGGSGRVAVGPVDRGGQGGSNGVGINLAVAVLAELMQFRRFCII